MNDRYYYLIASLPTLKIAEKPFYDTKSFIELCEPWMPAGDLEQLLATLIEEPFAPESPVAEVSKQWENFEINVRNALVSLRAKRLLREEKHSLRSADELDADMHAKVTDIFSKDDPLAIEHALIELRWKFLDQHEALYSFELDFLIIYYLKLQLLERRARMNKPAGRAYIEKTIYSAAVEN